MPLEDNEHISGNRALFTLLIPSGLCVRKVIHACYQMMVVLHHFVACLLQRKKIIRINLNSLFSLHKLSITHLKICLVQATLVSL